MATYRIEVVDPNGNVGLWGYGTYQTKAKADQHAKTAAEQNPEAKKVRAVKNDDE